MPTAKIDHDRDHADYRQRVWGEALKERLDCDTARARAPATLLDRVKSQLDQPAWFRPGGPVDG